MAKSTFVTAPFTIGEKAPGGITPPADAISITKLTNGIYVTRFTGRRDRRSLLDLDNVEVKRRRNNKREQQGKRQQNLDQMIRAALRK